MSDHTTLRGLLLPCMALYGAAFDFGRCEAHCGACNRNEPLSMKTAPRTPARRSKPPAHIVHKDKDLRIDASPQEVARAILQGGAKPRPETRRPKAKTG